MNIFCSLYTQFENGWCINNASASVDLIGIMLAFGVTPFQLVTPEAKTSNNWAFILVPFCQGLAF